MNMILIEPGWRCAAALLVAAMLVAAGCTSLTGLPTTTTATSALIRQCAGLAIAEGRLWVDSETNTLSTCGDYPGNVAVLRDVHGAPPNRYEQACTGTPIPRGWSVVKHKTVHGRCADFPDNVVILQNSGNSQPVL